MPASFCGSIGVQNGFPLGPFYFEKPFLAAITNLLRAVGG